MENGFGNFNEPTQWEKYVGKGPQCFATHNGGSVYGVLKTINKHEGYAEVQPSMIFNIDGSQAFINNKDPTRMPLPLGIIRPLPENMSLEDYVADYNHRKAEESKPRFSGTESRILLPYRDFSPPSFQK